MKEHLRKLLALRDLDGAILAAERKVRILEGEVAAIERRIAAEEKDFQRRLEEHRALRLRATEKAMEADEIDEKIRTYQHKLDHDIIPYKEMEYLREQVEFLKSRIDEVEEEAIRLMDEVEEDERRLQEEKKAHEERLARLKREKSEVEEKISALQREIQELKDKREAAIGEIPAHLRSHYERLREMYPDPVVPIVNGTCSGCHLNISQTTVDRARQGEVVTCDNCSRFLYLESAL
ncbi:zinc ribbon domain-containing protein [Candidatus Bipolaricaulota sp. J31]